MCRSIKTLRGGTEPVPEEALRAAALQFVRKVSGYRQPSGRNAAAFEAAVDEVSEATRGLLAALRASAARPGTGAALRGG